jgi:transposase
MGALMKTSTTAKQTKKPSPVRSTHTPVTPTDAPAPQLNIPVIGIDVSKLDFEVYVQLPGKKARRRRFDNRESGFRTLAEWLRQQGIPTGHAILEATGTYSDDLALFLYEAGHRVSVINPARVKGFGESELRRNKTDRADAALLYLFGVQKNPELWHPPAPEARALQILARHLDDLLEQKTQISNRLTEGRLIPAVRESLNHLLAAIEKQITEIEQEIARHFEQHPKLKADRELLLTIPGIGNRTAARLLAELACQEGIETAAQAAAYAGLTPQRHESGTSVRGASRLSKIGSTRLRHALYFPAVTALRYNPLVKALGERLTERGKHKLLIIGAAMHKLLRIAFGVLKNQKPFDEKILQTA